MRGCGGRRSTAASEGDVRFTRAMLPHKGMTPHRIKERSPAGDKTCTYGEHRDARKTVAAALSSAGDDGSACDWSGWEADVRPVAAETELGAHSSCSAP